MPIGMLFRFGCSGLFIEVLSPIHLFQFAKSYRVSSTKTKKGQKSLMMGLSPCPWK